MNIGLRDGEGKPHVAAATEAGARDGENAFFLEETDEGQVIGDRSFGKDVERALRAWSFIAHGVEGVAKQVALQLILSDVNGRIGDLRDHELPERGCVDVAENTVGERAGVA